MGAVLIDAVDTDFTSAQLGPTDGPLERVQAGEGAGAIDSDFIPTRDRLSHRHTFDLHGEHDGLRAEFLRPVRDQIGIAHGLGVDRDLLRANRQHGMHVVDRLDAPADAERHEHLAGNPAHHFQIGSPAFGAGEDVEDDDLVDLLVVDEAGQVLDGRDVDVVLKGVALGDQPIPNVEAGNQPWHERGHGRSSRVNEANRCSRFRPTEPDFSMWNCVAMMCPRATIAAKSPS